jgi:NAD-dependent dihydropyrimidine dehydrogenase PreA subunit
MKVKKFILSLFLLIIAFAAFAENPDKFPNLENCKTCIYASTEAPSISSILFKMGGIIGIIILATLYGWFSYHKKIYLFLGSLAALLVICSYTYSIEIYKNQDSLSPLCDTTTCIVLDSLQSFNQGEFLPAGDEFESVTENDEFSADLDEFSASDTDKKEAIHRANKKEPLQTMNSNNLLYQTIILLMLSAFIGITIKYQFVRSLRGIILLSSLVYLGFIKGACPCMIMSFQNVVLFLSGSPVSFLAMLWFLGLVVVTYFFGKTWCGWLCHLGALQDFLFRISSRKWLMSEKSQSVMKYVQIGLLVGLLIQLMATRSIIWIQYDPFKVAFNFFSSNIAGYVLLVLLLLSSVLIYRPFCRIVCPVGLILGWVTKIPGARKLTVNELTCSSCKSCTRSCKQQTIRSVNGKIRINTEDCILCGDCIHTCKKDSLRLKNKSA